MSAERTLVECLNEIAKPLDPTGYMFPITRRILHPEQVAAGLEAVALAMWEALPGLHTLTSAQQVKDDVCSTFIRGASR